MEIRPYTTDKPQRESYGRSLVVRARLDASNYLVDTGFGVEMAYYSGAVLLSLGQRVSAIWASEAFMWLIRGPDSPEEPTAAATQQSGGEVPVDGSGA